jgi:hypothetical protein
MNESYETQKALSIKSRHFTDFNHQMLPVMADLAAMVFSSCRATHESRRRHIQQQFFSPLLPLLLTLGVKP